DARCARSSDAHVRVRTHSLPGLRDRLFRVADGLPDQLVSKPDRHRSAACDDLRRFGPHCRLGRTRFILPQQIVRPHLGNYPAACSTGEVAMAIDASVTLEALNEGVG